ncbi:MAG: hypothetical protein V7K64_20645 [Nostoc sp.]|uniref:hypothetical protein n=1 Tax=Nostoc sp. TaxID=1180 RepID=UPI002FEF1ABA
MQHEDKELTKFKIWNTDQGEVKSISFSRDGKLLATTGAKGTVYVWNLENSSNRPTSTSRCVFNASNTCTYNDKEKDIWSVASRWQDVCNRSRRWHS